MAIGFKPKAEMTLSLPGCSPSEILLDYYTKKFNYGNRI
nr:MAG TPA: hypothetical protein [Caudoviricetes sp.]